MSAFASDPHLTLPGLMVTMFLITTTYAQEPGSVQKQSVPQNLNQVAMLPEKAAGRRVTNPHWQPDGCNTCHIKTPTGNALHLRSNSSEKLCNSCHESISSHSYIHPTGMPVNRKMLKRMPAGFRKAISIENGRVSCRTCHDLTMTCLPKRANEKFTNPRFFRGGPYKDRTDICYLCHDAGKYQRLNPHDQLTRSGQVKKQSCLICHKDGSKLKTASSIDEVDFNVTDDPAKMCTGCHPYQPHPGGSFSFSGKGPPNHLVQPSREVASRMKLMSKKNGIVLPLAPGSGKIFCGTCHNPHQKGVLMNAAARGAGSKNQLRMQQMCANCHDK